MKTVKVTDLSRKLKGFFKGSVQTDRMLSGYTSIKIGGRVLLFLEPQNNIDLAQGLRLLDLRNMPFRVIGNGTNLLINDRHLEIVVIKLSSLFFKEITIQKDVLYASGGVSIAQLLNFSIKNGICGLEFLAGIPGTIGGALVMNAGVRNSLPKASRDDLYLSVSDLLTDIEVMDKQGEIFKLSKTEAGFAYRGSKLDGLIVLGAYFKIRKSTGGRVCEAIKTFLKRRKILELVHLASAGCVFKNPTGCALSAGELIDKAGLKGHSIGQAQVSQVHANFIINRGGATFSQVCELMDFVRVKVKRDFKVKLESEVKVWN